MQQAMERFVRAPVIRISLRKELVMKCSLCNGTGSRVLFNRPVPCDCALFEPEPSPAAKSALVLEDMKSSKYEDWNDDDDDYCPCCGEPWEDCYCGDEDEEDYY
jgi:hypothetical protein